MFSRVIMSAKDKEGHSYISQDENKKQEQVKQRVRHFLPHTERRKILKKILHYVLVQIATLG
jgi:hypothetical protein